MPRAATLGVTVDHMLVRNGESVVLERGSALLAAQVFMVDRYVTASQLGVLGITVASGERGAATIRLIGADTANIQRGDRFVLGRQHYSVIFAHSADDHQRVAFAEAIEV